MGHHQHPGTESLHLVEHVAGHDHALALRTQPVEELDHLPPLTGIEPGEGFVQGNHQGIVDNGLGQFDALAHPLGVGGEPTSVVGIEFHGLNGLAGRLVRALEVVEAGGQLYELPAAQVIEQRFLLGGHADAAQHGYVGSGILAQHGHRSVGGPG